MSAALIKVLLVDDDEDDFIITRDLISQIRERRHQLDWVDHYDDGLAALQRHEYDLCLLDYRLGEHTGLELLRESKKFSDCPPIIFLTGQGDKEIDLEAMKAGAADYLVKAQLTADTLERAIRHAIERRNAQETLRRERDFVSRIMETSPAGIVVTDAAGKITFANRRAEEVLQCSQDDLLHWNVFDWFAADAEGNSLPKQTSQLQQVVGKGEPASDLRHVVENPNGMRILLSTNATPLFNAGARIDGMIVTVEDITQRLALAVQLRQSQKLESLGQLAAGVAHDINNILTIIQGHAGLVLRAMPATSSATKSLQQIDAACDRAASFIKHLLTFSRKQIFRTKVLDLNAVLRSLETVLPRMLGEHIALEIHCDLDLPRITADAGMVEQIVMNLAVNSRDAMSKGGKLFMETALVQLNRTSVSQHPEARVGRFARLTVADNGCGMERQVLNRIFEPFFTTKDVDRGTGLGLASVYGVVRQHRGWVEVESEVGIGTTFKIFLPAAEENVVPPESEAKLPEPVEGGAETILLAEDEPILLELMREVLTGYSYKVLTASCGSEALRMWEQHEGRVDLLMTDMVMPGGMTGDELAAELKRRQPDLKVVYTSGYCSSLEGKNGNDEEIIFLPKPYHPDEAAGLIRKTLDADARQQTEVTMVAS